MVAKTEMAMAQVAEGRTMDEKEQAEDTNLDVLLQQIQRLPRMMRKELRACKGRVTTMESMSKYPPKDG